VNLSPSNRAIGNTQATAITLFFLYPYYLSLCHKNILLFDPEYFFSVLLSTFSPTLYSAKGSAFSPSQKQDPTFFSMVFLPLPGAHTLSA